MNPSTQTDTTSSLIGKTGEESSLIAKTFQGLEPLLAQELTELGATDIQIGRRMVTFSGDKEMLYRANFCLRTAIRVLKPIKLFKAKSADDVYEAVKTIDWSQYLTPQTTFAVDSVVFSPEFRHSKFVAYKVKDAIADQFRERTGSRPNVSVSNPDIQLHIHISDYDATLALDSSGESLHRRGYRQETVAAPINEVLAAGIIMMTGWKGETDFIDPFCGSGTFCIEAALIARGIAPGIFRQSYAFEKWPDFDRELFDRIYNDDSNDREFTHHIYGRDNDPKAVGIATRNVSSPDLLGLYKTIGQKLKREFAGGEAWILSYREECFESIGLKPSLKTPLFNGSLECELRKYVMFDGRLSEHRASGGTVKTDAERRQMSQKRRFKQHRDDFKRSFSDDDREDRRSERREDRFGDRREDRRGDKREFRHGDRDDHRFNKFSNKTFRPKGNDRSSRQEARRRFFGGKGSDED